MITLITYDSDYFILGLVWIVAATLALSRWRRHPRVSRSTLTAILIFFTESLVRVFTTLYLPLMLHNTGWEQGASPFSYLYSSSGLGTAVVKALASSSSQP